VRGPVRVGAKGGRHPSPVPHGHFFGFCGAGCVGLPEAEGLLVRAVEDDSLASKAGLQEGDLIVAASGQEVKSVDDLFDALDRLGTEGTLELKVLRGTEERTVPVRPS